jgi:hypothetical protein
VNAVRSATDDLNASMQKIGEAVYGSQGSADGSPGGEENPEPAPEGTVEGEFREV